MKAVDHDNGAIKCVRVDTLATFNIFRGRTTCSIVIVSGQNTRNIK